VRTQSYSIFSLYFTFPFYIYSSCNQTYPSHFGC